MLNRSPNPFNHPVFTHQKRCYYSWLPALIGGLAAVTSGAIGAISQNRQNKQNLQASKDLMQYQWNNYGSPQAQKAAYNAAGINPFAQGQISADTPQAQIPDQQAPGLVLGQALQSFITPLSQLLMVQSQIKQIDAVTNKTDEETKGVTLSNAGIDLDNRLKQFDLGYIKPETLKQIQAQIAQTEAGTHLTRRQIKLVAEQILKTQYESQGVDLKNRFQQMENEWKRIQGERGMPENLAEWQALQNNRLRQQIAIDIPVEEMSKFRKQALDNMSKLFDDMNKPGSFEHFMGYPLGEGGKTILRAIVSMLLFKIMREF